MKDDVTTEGPGRIARLGSTIRNIPWRNAASGKWWWRWFNRSMVQSGRVTTLLALFGILVIRIEDPNLLQLVRARVFDLYQQIQPRQLTEESPVVIADIDEKSLAEMGQFPWPRTYVARLVDELAKLDAGVVGFDIVFAEADQTSVSTVVNAIPLNVIDTATRERLKQVPTNDAVLADSLTASGRVVMGQVVVTDRPNYNGESPLTSFATVGDDAKRYVENHVGVRRPLPILDKAAAGRGIFSIGGRFYDGIVRQVSMVFASGQDLYPSLVLEMMRVKLGARTVTVAADQVKGGVTRVSVRPARSREQYVFKTGANADVWVYFRDHQSFTPSYISATDIINGRVPKEKVAGKFVLVGTSAIGLLDLRSTPLDPVLPGVEVHANIIENIVFQNQLSRPAEATLVEWGSTAVIALLMIIITPMVSIGVGFGIFAAISASLTAWSWNIFTTKLELFDPSFPVATAFLIYAFLAFAGYLRTESQRKQVRSAFGQYLSPALVQRLSDDPSKLTLGGENRDMTFMFSDVRGFTTISELFDAQGLTRLINRLLTPLTDVILKTNGTIDKYMGDCVMAFWNAPLDVPQHPAQACRSALAMIDETAKLNAALEAEAKIEGREHRKLSIGIGINSGIACVGNMGSEQRFGYSVLGDHVNLASRLEGQSKTYHLTIVLGENTVHAVEPDFAVLELDLIQVKGKHQAVRIFTLLGEASIRNSEWFGRLKVRHDAMLTAYRAQNWDEAERELAECRSILAGQAGLPGETLGFYDVTEQRIRAFRENPPPVDWNGVYVAESK